ncbi:MAG: BLUF domain-containing protein [Sphingomonas sp.]|uniref:BLUF domain-containing protein n=1 Tax=Sphingomonas sp. TaxID=28214 RepID=UPI001AD5A988|nr:BLUF domain-containing protein [Sphingomonas sp.]MBN8808417.1 BLUF domain-containing protein [Sphingomonas sp.]
MNRLLYISTARRLLANTELEGILRTSRVANAAVDVTGILAVGGRRFLQLLEGPADAVETVFARIQRDPRHFAIVKLSNHEIDQRQTGDWSMAFHDVASGRDMPAIVAKLIKEIRDPALAAEFSQFAKRHAA